MVIKDTGNVGIGTSSPGNKLDILAATSSEGLRITSTVSGNAGILKYVQSLQLLEDQLTLNFILMVDYLVQLTNS